MSRSTLPIRRAFLHALRPALALPSLLLALLALTGAARAATFTVDRTDDITAATCSAAPNDCSLRGAITAANFAGGANTIAFSATVFAAPGPYTISLTSLLPALDSDIDLQGPGASVLTVQRSTGSLRIFNILAGNTVSISGLTIANAQSDGGGGIRNQGTLTVTACTISGNSVGTGGGGGIWNNGSGTGNSASLTLINCTLSGNSAGTGGGIDNDGSNDGSATLSLTDCTISGNSAGVGGGIYNDGTVSGGATGSATLTVTTSTLSTNSATSGGGGGIYNGGAAAGSSATLTVTQSTFSANTAATSGGAVYNDGASGSATLDITQSTFSTNSATTSGGGIYNDGTTGIATVTLGGTILQAGASGTNIVNVAPGTITSNGYNLSNDNGGGFLTGTGDKPSTLTRLATAGLQDNGGPTKTIGLQSTSAAVDAGDPAIVAGFDQRGTGFSRVLNGRSDIGAFESDIPQSGSTFTVNTIADHNDGICGTTDCTLNEAITTANAHFGADTIDFDAVVFVAPGPYTIQLASVLPNIATNINLQGPGASVLTVRGEGATDPYRIFNVTSSASISGLTISNGLASGTVTGPGGGGILNAGTLTVTDCVFSGNGAAGSTSLGGGIYNNHSTLTVTGCTFSGNTAGGGGGLFNDGSATATVTNCTFSNGLASGTVTGPGGGGILNAGTLTVTDCVFSGNGAAGSTSLGGGIYNNHSTLTVTGCTFSGNTAGGGGAFFNDGRTSGSATATVTNCTFSGNTATYGGAFFNDGHSSGNATLALDSCTLSGNVANFGGGGVYNLGTSGTATLQIGNTLLAANTPQNLTNINGTLTSLGYNLSSDPAGGDAATGPGGLLTAIGDIRNTDPKLDPAGLQDNTGPTPTIALLVGSPAINKGNPSSFPATDQRGVARPQPASGRADIGAYEVGGIAINDVTVTEGAGVTADFTVTLAPASTQMVTVDYATADGTALAGSDYTATSGTVTFLPGETSKPVSVTILNDAAYEPAEAFKVQLTNPVNALVSDGKGVGTIRDNHPTPALSVSDPADVIEGDTGVKPMDFKLTLDNKSGSTITVDYVFAGTATLGTDYTIFTPSPITFSPGQLNKTVRVNIKGDKLSEASETVRLTVTKVTFATIAKKIGTGSIVDNDPLPALSIDDVTLNEGNSSTTDFTFTVTLSASSGQSVKVSYSTANGAALQPGDYTKKAGTLTFAPGETSKTITVPVIGDTAAEATETFGVNLSSPVNATISDSHGQGTITNDD